MAGDVKAMRARFDELLRQAAELAVAMDYADGRIKGVPHYVEIETRAEELGHELSRQVQARHMGEIVARQATRSRCNTCGRPVELEVVKRSVRSVAGTVELVELVGRCPSCRRSFFPLREPTGLDARAVTPTVVLRLVALAAETRSFERAEKAARDGAGLPVSAKLIERLVRDVGEELA
ncbi:MAG: hypothetical protein K6T86_11580 [Pirellulales bacterium]|nr:hypothetical protein [Pirellulales bacterium]